MNSPSSTQLPPNPYATVLKHFLTMLKGIKWEAPWLPSIIQCLVLCFLLILFGILYCTIGIISQVEISLRHLISSTYSHIHPSAFIENSAYIASVGVFIALWIIPWLVQLPFAIIGWAWSASRARGIFLTILFIVLGVLTTSAAARERSMALLQDAVALVLQHR